MDPLTACALIVVFGTLYFLPTIVACQRDVPGKFWIFLLNLFFGCTGVGWLTAFIFACGLSRRRA